MRARWRAVRAIPFCALGSSASCEERPKSRGPWGVYQYKGNKNIEDRFAVMERELLARGNSLKDASLEEMESGWVRAKSLSSEG